jgi:hypothetical protein
MTNRVTAGTVIGFVYNFGWLTFVPATMWLDQRRHGTKGDAEAMG